MRRLLSFSVVALALIGFGVSTCFAQDAAATRHRFLEAAKNGRRNEVEALLKAGVVTSVKDASGRTALHLAAGGAHDDMVQTLLEHGADLNAKLPVHLQHARHVRAGGRRRQPPARGDELSLGLRIPRHEPCLRSTTRRTP